MIYQLSDDQPILADDAWVADNATVVGKVELKAQASVWFNAVIRGDMESITVGEQSNIQDAAVLHTDWGYPMIIGRGVTVGHKVMLHGCTIDDYALIGINAVVLNGARIGEHAVIGANALVTEGTTIPPRSLAIGAPAKVVRALSDDEIKGLEQSADHYVGNAQRYRDRLLPIG